MKEQSTKGLIQMANTGKIAGVMGLFAGPAELTSAAEKARDAKIELFDCYTPYPIHGLEHAQGLKPSLIPFVTLGAGIAGCLAGFGMQYWTSAVDWPINVGGKPFNSWPAFVPVMFETTVLFAGLATFGALLFFCKLPNVRKKAYSPGITCDEFALVIEAPEPKKDPDADEDAQPTEVKFDSRAAEAFLKSSGAKEVRIVYEQSWFGDSR